MLICRARVSPGATGEGTSESGGLYLTCDMAGSDAYELAIRGLR
jgi:hypothetical protein